ncbi:ensconsin isoform 2-T2 [Rhinophrynus dorsalis]
MLIFLKPRKKRIAASKMLGSMTGLRQERMKKTGARPTPPVLFTINEEDEQQKNGHGRRAKAPDGSQAKTQEKKATAASSRPVPAVQHGKDNAGSKSEPHLIMKVDERQRLARERREEREKLMAARESLWLEKELRARQHYEKQLEERKKKLEEQRIKEERRRAAVDEKRKLRLEEEKERHEAVVRRTIERSQKPKQKNNRWSWGGALQSSTNISSSGYFVESSFSIVDLSELAHHFQAKGGVKRDPDRRSVSTMNLSKHVDPVINKRLSTSSATLLNSPDKARRPQLSPWESTVVSRLLTPTHSYLARSKSTAALSGDAASFSPISPQPFKTANNKNVERPKLFVTTPEVIARRKTTHFAGTSSMEKKEKERENERENVLLTPSSNFKRAHSPTVPKPKSPAPFPVGILQKSPSTSSSISKPASSSTNTIKVLTNPQLSPDNVRPIRKEVKEDTKKKDEEKEVDESAVENVMTKEPLPTHQENADEKTNLPPVTKEAVQDSPVLSPAPALPSPTIAGKPFAGTTNPEEATRILAEKRRIAREQREREEQEKKEKEEEERKKKEELARRKAEERARREEEAQKLEAERKQKEEEERQEREKLLLQLAEEKEQKEREEAERLQKQKEEADRIRIEREKHFQKEEQERSERKKRLEEIMKRTRRNEGGDKQSNTQRNGEIPKSSENTAIAPSPLQQEQETELLQSNTGNPHNGQSAVPTSRIITCPQTLPVDSTEKQPNENGLGTPNNNFEEIINLPVGTKPMKRDSLNNDENNIQDIPLNPILAFQEEGTIVPLPQVDNVQTPQTAEVI